MSSNKYDHVVDSETTTGGVVTAVTEGENKSNKRALNDTSFEESSSYSPTQSNSTKRFSSTGQLPGSPPSIPDDTVITYGLLVSTIERIFSRFEAGITSQINSLSTSIDLFNTRLQVIEEKASSTDIIIDNLEGQVNDLERKCEDLEHRLTSVESASGHIPVWKPVGVPTTKVLLLGDSNSGGKVRFGQDKGTLGRALPGAGHFHPTIEDLPPPNCEVFSEVSDVIISVGTNNFKLPSSEPEAIANHLYTYVKSLSRAHPAAHIFLPGVLPVHNGFTDLATNSKIQLYNHFLRNMCKNLNTSTTYIDVNVFCGPDGGLKDHLSKGASDPLHLNDQGIKLLASRFKHALRSHHNLPTGTRRPQSHPSQNSLAPQWRPQSHTSLNSEAPQWRPQSQSSHNSLAPQWRPQSHPSRNSEASQWSSRGPRGNSRGGTGSKRGERGR